MARPVELASFALCTIAFNVVLLGAEESASKQHVQSSDKTVVNEIVYGLEEESGKLYLTSQPVEGADRELQRLQLQFEVPQDSKVTELCLENLGGKNLVAVVKLNRGADREFHCLTFISGSDGHVREKFSFYQAKFFTTEDDLKVLALGGKHFHGSVFIVLGKMKPKRGELSTITEGVFYFSLCPWPPSQGELSPFRAESIPLEIPVN